MTREQLVEYVQTESPVELNKAVAGKIVAAVLDGIKAAVITDKGITLQGFGTFKASKRKAHKGRNPKTGEEIFVPEKTVPTFKAAKDFKDGKGWV